MLTKGFNRLYRKKFRKSVFHLLTCLELYEGMKPIHSILSFQFFIIKPGGCKYDSSVSIKLGNDNINTHNNKEPEPELINVPRS